MPWVCSPASAQAASDTLHQAITLSIGAFNENRRDAADSPLAYAGTGAGERIEYVRTRAGRRWNFALDAGTATIVPQMFSAQSASEEGFGSYSFSAGTEWKLRGASDRFGELSLGVQFGASLTVARHMYNSITSGPTEQTFDVAALTLAPAARWARPLGAGTLSAALAVPLLAWADRPYADVRYANQFVDFRFVPVTRYREADGSLSYDVNTRTRYGLVITYRIGAVEFDDMQPVRRVSQSLTVALVRRFGPLP